MRKVTPACMSLGCVKIMKDGECLAFLSPRYQWRNGQCYGFNDDIEILNGLEYDDCRSDLLALKGKKYPRRTRNNRLSGIELINK